MFNVKVDSLSSNMAIENLSSCKQWFTYPGDMSKKLKKIQSDTMWTHQTVHVQPSSFE